MLSLAKDISCFPSRDRSDAGRAMLDVGQSLLINLYKHIEFKIVVNFLNPFYSGFDPGLYCDRAYTSINTLLWHALHFFLLTVTRAFAWQTPQWNWQAKIKIVLADPISSRASISFEINGCIFFFSKIIIIICSSPYFNCAINIARSIILFSVAFVLRVVRAVGLN